MSVAAGSRLGPYVIGERVGSVGLGDWFAASEAGLERPVSLVVTSLPGDEAALSALRARARQLAAVTDARVLPVYGQGEDEHVLWLATRQIAGRPWREIGRLDVRRAARLGAQVAGQLAALHEAGAAPAALAPDDLWVEGSGEQERAWLLPDPLRAVSEDAVGSTRSLVALLEERTGRPLAADPPSDPQMLGETLAAQAAGGSPGRRKLLVGAAATAAIAALAIGLALAFTGRDKSTKLEAPPVSNAPIARVSARISLNATVGKLAIGSQNAWIATLDGTLIHVDPATNRVLGAPLKAFPKQSYVDLALPGDVLWAGGPSLLLRVEASTGRVLSRTRLGKRAVSGILVGNGFVWTTLNDDAQSPAARAVALDPATGRELHSSASFGTFPIPVTANEHAVWALSGDGAFSRIAGGDTPTTMVVGEQAGFPVERGDRVWIPTRIDRTVVVVDRQRMTPQGVFQFGGDTLHVVAGAGSIWVLTANPSRIYRIDPVVSRFLGSPLAAPAGASVLAFGAGSLWVDDPKAKTLVRLAPALPAPAARPAEQPSVVLANGPVRPRARLRVPTVKPPFSIVAPDDAWVAEGIAEGSFQIETMRHHGTGVGVSTPAQVFDASGRLFPVRSAADFLRTLRSHPGVHVRRVTPVTLGGLKGFRVRVQTDPKPPFPALCGGNPCVVVFPLHRATFVLTKGFDELTFVKRGRVLFFIDATFGDKVDPALAARIRRLVGSIQFEK